jgi:predicted ester cyclase
MCTRIFWSDNLVTNVVSRTMDWPVTDEPTLTRLITIINLSATHTGESLGHAPTGKRFTVRNVQVLGFRDGKTSDRWGSTDELGILQRLSLI